MSSGTAPAESSVKILILGLGNPLVTDDSVGLRVAEALKPLLANRTDVEVSEDYWGGLRLMERMIGFDRAIVVDAIQTGGPPGTIHLLTPDGIATRHNDSAHDVNLSTALEFGRQAGITCRKTAIFNLSASRPKIYLLSESDAASGPSGRSACGRCRAEGPGCLSGP